MTFDDKVEAFDNMVDRYERLLLLMKRLNITIPNEYHVWLEATADELMWEGTLNDK